MVDPPRRKSPRLVGFDYGEPGMYFVTICLQIRSELFATIDHTGCLTQSDVGTMMSNTWSEIPRQFNDVALDAMIVMPDHLHGIIFVGVDPWSNRRSSLSDVIRWFKSVSTTRYGSGVHQQDWPAFERHLWQRSFYDRIIRDDTDVNSCRRYIEGNPARWAERRRE